MVSKQWKGHERFVAATLKGHRIPRGANFSRSLPDVVADSSLTLARSSGLIYAECKYSSKKTWVQTFESIYDGHLLYLPNNINKYLFFDIKDIHLLADPSRISKALLGPTRIKKIPRFITSYMDQSRSYVALTGTDPITKATLQAIVNPSFKDGYDFSNCPVLPIVVIGQRYKTFRLAYTTHLDLLKFYSAQNDKSFWNI